MSTVNTKTSAILRAIFTPVFGEQDKHIAIETTKNQCLILNGELGSQIHKIILNIMTHDSDATVIEEVCQQCLAIIYNCEKLSLNRDDITMNQLQDYGREILIDKYEEYISEEEMYRESALANLHAALSNPGSEVSGIHFDLGGENNGK
jgi:hypothetical protein